MQVQRGTIISCDISSVIPMIADISSSRVYSLYIILTLYNYHHSTKLYQKISRACCRLHSTSNNAKVNKRVIFFSSIAWYYCDNDEPLYVQTQCASLAVPDTDFHVTCSADMDSRVTCL